MNRKPLERFILAVHDATNAVVRWIREGEAEPTWTTKDGRVLRIADMTDGHLIYTIRMLRRGYVRKLALQVAWYTTCAGPQGDMAQMAFESEFDDLMEATWGDVAEPVFWQLAEEAKRRPEIRDAAAEILAENLEQEQTAIELSLLSGKDDSHGHPQDSE